VHLEVVELFHQEVARVHFRLSEEGSSFFGQLWHGALRHTIPKIEDARVRLFEQLPIVY